MKLLDLIKALSTIEKKKKMIFEFLPHTELDMIDVYMESEINIQSEIKLFDADEIANSIIIEKDGIKYVNLFPLYYLQDLIVDLSKNETSDEKIAERIIQFRISVTFIRGMKDYELTDPGAMY